MLTIRGTRRADADAMSALRIASITTLCAADHDNDADVLAAWLANKDGAAFRTMMRDGDSLLLVAEMAGQLVGLGGAAGARITLNYVDPAFRFQGVSKAMLAALETVIAAAGFDAATLHSTATALPFYRGQGWSDAGVGSRLAGYPMCKSLA